ncbi:MAG TPA: hypothetical protein VF294_15020 [Polyangiaceae bacterium]
MVAIELQLGARLARAVAAFGVALGLAACAARWYATPTLSGAPEHAIWSERDVLCSVASSAVALASGAFAGRSPRPGATAAGSPVLRVAIWLGLSLLFLAAWAHYLFLLTLLIAPTHAFAALRVLALWTSWRSDVQLNRRR